MGNKLSYSQLEKFKFCGESWRLHYKERIRSSKIPSPLIFGAAIGKAFEVLLKEWQKFLDDQVILEQGIPYSTELGLEEFDRLWKQQEINGVLTDLENNPDIEWLKSDFDEELGSTPWESMRTKAHLMIEAFRTKFLPRVTKVYSTEEKVELSSGEDINIGFADTVVDLEGYYSPVVLDFKTAGKPYTRESVRESVQLSQYLYQLSEKYNTNLAGYVVFLKNITKNRTKICSKCGFDGSGGRYKTCNNTIITTLDTNLESVEEVRCDGTWNETIDPECNVQIIIDEIPLESQEKVIDEIGLLNDQINEGIITKNLEGCSNYFGKPCIYYGLCHEGKMDGLIKLDKKDI